MNAARAVVFLLALVCGAEAGAEESSSDEALVYAYELFLEAEPNGPDSLGIWLKLGNLRFHQSHFDDARLAYAEVIRLAATRGDREMVLAGRLGTGLTYGGESRYEEAVAELTRAIEDAGAAPVAGNLISIYRELANIGLHTLDYPSVLEYGETARRAYHRLGYREDEALMLFAIGVAHAERGDLDKAERALHESFRLFTALGDGDLADTGQAGRVARVARGYGIADDGWK